MARTSPGYNANGVVEIIGDIDFSTVNDGAGIAAAAVEPVISLPANCKVLAVGYEILEPSETMDDFDFGDGGDPNRYLDAEDATADAGTTGLGEAASTLTHLYTSADTLDIVNSHAETVLTGKIRFSAFCILM